jgi:Fe-S-cluster containining protein
MTEARSLGCARCGDCCERLWLSVDLERLAELLERDELRGTSWENAVFLTRHWRRVEGDESTDYVCDAFDSVHRTCTAYDERPPICAGYPWYGGEPTEGRITRVESRCSFLLDLPPTSRPEGARPLIPVEIVRR